jgi:hypothetical protein
VEIIGIIIHNLHEFEIVIIRHEDDDFRVIPEGGYSGETRPIWRPVDVISQDRRRVLADV